MQVFMKIIRMWSIIDYICMEFYKMPLGHIANLSNLR
jgi:hypothetical protein